MKHHLIHFLLVFFFATQVQAETLDAIPSFPLYGTWNTFNEQINILECSNYNEETVNFELRLINSNGSTRVNSTFSIGAQSTTHVFLNDIRTDEQDPSTGLGEAYGTFRISVTSSPATLGQRVACDTVIYKVNSGVVEYAYALPIRNALTGETSGTFNSIDPQGAGNPTFNYLTITNPGDSAFNAELIRYDQNGQQLSSTLIFDLVAGERRDISLDSGEELVGFYRIVPASSNAAYQAFVTRSSEKFTFPLMSRKGGCSDELIPLSTMDPADNWVEIANTTSDTATITIEVRDVSGTVLNTETRTLLGYAQYHFFANSIIGDRALGTVRVRCGDPLYDGLLVQSVYYGKNSANTLEWAYASQAEGLFADAQTELAFGYNTFLGGQNWLKQYNSSGSAFDGSVEITPFDNPLGATSLPSALTSRNAGDTSINSQVQDDSIGSVSIRPSSLGSKQGGELIRVFPDSGGGIGSILRIAPKVISRPQVTIETFLSAGLVQPLYVANAGDGSNRLFFVEKLGAIKVFKDGAILPTPFIDLSASLPPGAAATEQGMQNITFHPNYAVNGKVYIMFVQTDGASRISEFTVSGNPDVLDPASERVLLTQSRAETFHTGGQMEFGTDGYLYFAFGDGGPQEDTLGEGQNTLSLNGTIGRIDVDSGMPYAVPADNPFVGNGNFRPEIWAYGFRNPYRFSFDNGRMFVSDVGQVRAEEIDIVERGGNYGWNLYEGTECFRPAANPGRTCADTEDLEFPIHDYPRSTGASVIGGYVYRGTAAAPLRGNYIFSDFVSRGVWILKEADDGVWERSKLATLPAGTLPVSFGVDENNEVYLIDILGKVFRFSVPS